MKIFWLAVLLPVLAEAQLHKGMAPQLPGNYLERRDFIAFENFRTRPRAPIAGRVVINGTPARTIEELFEIWAEEVLAFLPEGEKIIQRRDVQNQIVWRYPVGTQVVHFLHWKDEQKSPFELRMIERVDEKRWAFGVYHKIDNQFVLQDYSGMKPGSRSFVADSGKRYDVKFGHIPLQVCQNCHARTTSAPHQYRSLEDVGPCEFTPNNPKVTNEWVNEFKRERGYDPVEIR